MHGERGRLHRGHARQRAQEVVPSMRVFQDRVTVSRCDHSLAKSTLGSTTTEIPGCSSSLCMVLFGGTSRRSAPSGTRRGVGCGEMSGCFQLFALFTLGFWTLLLRARGSGKRLPRCFGVCPRLLLGEFQLSLVSLPEPFAPGGLDWDGALVMRQSTVAIGRISCPLCTRCSHLEFGALFPCPCLWLSMFRLSGCC